ncbi:hypothetical protein IW252_001154 [Zhihengliuella flava]|uniref:Uncharacterized protein n=1 Tax=Zhihengliuella flava TaxID=1285193 RepID=A0A931D9C5_9MICC|nr:hypothetical protein [Zhihengliuella flava]
MSARLTRVAAQAEYDGGCRQDQLGLEVRSAGRSCSDQYTCRLAP